MSRIANGWILNRLAPEDESNEVEEDRTAALDGLSDWERAQLKQEVINMGGATSPMGAQREADEQRGAWGKQWAWGNYAPTQIGLQR